MVSSLRTRAWRWHLLAALLVVPFVLWQSITGTIYLWSQAYVDARHSELRFVSASAERASVDAQLAIARQAMPGARVGSILLPADPLRSTLVAFEDAQGMPMAVFIDPYRGLLLGVLSGVDWAPGWSRKLHGGWPLGSVGSWLLELGACWTIVMVLTGLYLWWPRDGRPALPVLLPRVAAGRRLFWRDLHACVAVWFSMLIVLFLLTAMPWTSFWGESVLRPVQRALNQNVPAAAGFAPVLVGTPGSFGAQSLDRMVADARQNGMQGDLMLYMIDGPPGSAVSLRSLRDRASEEQYVLFDRANGARVGAAGWSDFPPLAKGIATGVDLHEGSYFGRVGPWINTALASALLWLAVTGVGAWWTRKPAGSAGIPPPVATRWPLWVLTLAVALCVLLPLLGLSVVCLWLGERAWHLLALAYRER